MNAETKIRKGDPPDGGRAADASHSSPQAVSTIGGIPVADLAKLREPFAAHHISKLPKETKAQATQRKADQDKGNWPPKCAVCEGYHHPRAVHLDYVGHAALTDRLLDVDPLWSWEPMAVTVEGLPAFDRNGGLWINLTVCGMTRPGYGCADGKSGGDAVKEIIGDALRNAAMRFGAALDLWHKGDLHAEDDTATDGAPEGQSKESAVSPPETPNLREQLEQSVAMEAEKPTRNWGGRYPTKTALRRARTVHHAELERIGVEGTFDDLESYLTSPEYQDYIMTAGEHHPLWLEGEIPPEMAESMPPEYIQTFALEQKARDMIAIRGNVPADAEPA